MPAKTFHQIKDANAEILRLSTELETAQASAKTSQEALSSAQSDHKAALEKKEGEHVAAIAAKDAKIKELEGANSKLSTDLSGAREEIKSKDAKIAELEGKVTTVERKAADIAAVHGGVQPIAAGKPDAKDSNDPRARMQEAWGRNFIGNSMGAGAGR